MQQGRKDPAWSFSERSDFSQIKRVMAKTLPVQIKSARAEIEELREKIALWRADAERFYPGFKDAHPDAPPGEGGRKETPRRAPAKKGKPATAKAKPGHPPARAKRRKQAA